MAVVVLSIGYLIYCTRFIIECFIIECFAYIFQSLKFLRSVADQLGMDELKGCTTLGFISEEERIKVIYNRQKVGIYLDFLFFEKNLFWY